MNPRTVLAYRLIVVLAFALAFAPSGLRAEVVRVEITNRTEVLDGQPFGEVGPYEKLTGKIYFAVDPRNPHNKVIVDLEKAPRHGNERVEFSADLVILKPKVSSRGNGVMFFDIVNRGNMLLLGTFNRAAERSSDPTTEAHFGDGFLMREGYTVVAVGWELSPNNPTVALYPPIATDGGKPIAGWIRNWFIPAESSTTFDLLGGYWTGFRSYPPLNPDDATYQLTERTGYLGEPILVPRENWQFGRLDDDKLVDDPHFLFLKTGFKVGHTYEVKYETSNPRVAGLGFAAVRDVASHFKYGQNPIVGGRFAYSAGASQTGRWLRAFVHEGFNTDERDRQVFDGIFMNVPGASLGSFNERFAQPNEGGFFETSPFPYLYETTRDPVTGKLDGLGARVPPGQHPKIFIVNSSFEYWGNSRAAALNHVSLDGAQDVREPENVRIYMYAGTQHGAGSFPPRDVGGQLRGNSNDYRWASRALLVALDGWVRRDESPPPSQHPRLSDRTLVSQKQVRFPNVPGVRWPYSVPGAYRADLPGPIKDHALPFLVPQVDGDGNEIAGIRLPDVAVPLATYTGWAFRREGNGPATELLPLVGSYLPFARTRAERQQTGDPRRSVEERYASRAQYLQQVEAAVRQLLTKRYVLEEDVGLIVDCAARHWDWLLATGAEGSGR